MNVYDFDNTIYDGESLFDFYLFCLKKDFKFIKYLKVAVLSLVKYKLCLITHEKLIKLCSKYVYDFLTDVGDFEQVAKEFWDKNEHKIKPWYSKYKKEDDVICSANFNVFLDEILNRINVKNCICSKVDTENKEVTALCFRSNKVALYKAKYEDVEIDNFYTDSKNDMPMIEISNNAYLVKNNKIKKIK